MAESLPKKPTDPGLDAARLEWLLRCEKVILSMCSQICSPKTTPEQFVAMQLGEPVPGRRAAR